MKTYLVIITLLAVTSARPQDEPVESNTQASEALIETIGEEINLEEDKDKPTETLENQCESYMDCKPYHYCYNSYWTAGATCETNFYKEDFTTATYCLDLAEGKEFPSHDHCQSVDAENRIIKPDESTHRCFAELGYICKDAYYMPCTPNHDPNGQAIEGEEEACPGNFTCQEFEYTEGGLRKVCIPDQPDATRFDSGDDVQCQRGSDCGYSEEEGAWTTCDNGQCATVQFK